MQAIRVAGTVFFVGAIISVLQRHDDTALLFASLGFGLVSVAESDVDWSLRLRRRTWRRDLVEPRWKITILGQVAQALSFACLLGFFAVTFLR